MLLRISPSPVIELNHAAAVSMVDGPARALDLIDALDARGGLKGHELLPAVRADLLRARPARRRARGVSGGDGRDALEPLRRFYARRMRCKWVLSAFPAVAVSHHLRFVEELLPALRKRFAFVAGNDGWEANYLAATTVVAASAGRLASSACSVLTVE